VFKKLEDNVLERALVFGMLLAFFYFLVHFMMERVQKLSSFECFSNNLLFFNQRVIQ
jgi:hypothetical protein